MNISIIIEFNPLRQSSATSNRWLTMIEGLAEIGVEIRLIIYGGYQSDNEATNWTSKGKWNEITYKYIAPLLIKGYFKRRLHNYIGSELRKVKISKLIIKELKNPKEIIWTDSSLFSFQLAVKLKNKQPQKLLFLEMSEFLDIHKYNKGNFMQRWKADRRQKYFDKIAFSKYDGIALMTETLLTHFKSHPKPHPKFLHLPMTVDLDRFTNEVEPLKEFVKPYIAFIGVMNDAKDGVNILIDAFSRICHQFPKYRLYLIGPWNYDTPNHLKMINDYELSNRINWMKEYPRDNISAIIKNADLLALPRPNSKQAQGGFPTKLGEYLATGNPICATTVGEIPNYLVDNESVYFAEPGSVSSFSDAMKRALSKPNEAKRIGTNGRKVAEASFNKDKQARILYKFLLQL